ncbi:MULTISPECIES: hypothetical protein [Streptomyces]|jgi:hypothetical protein|uniref:Uncharacterized protein n=1 Tax=Streptomyces sp. 900129855 TaxID=3155129 RepID=A0ABV2ZZ69_9ACTN
MAQWGVFNDELCVYVADTKDEADAAEERERSTEDGYYADVTSVRELCPDHEEQPKDSCEHCHDEQPPTGQQRGPGSRQRPPASSRSNQTREDPLNDRTATAEFTPYGPDHFAPHLPFARRGYLFTVPGSFPEDTPAHTNVTTWKMAVYRAHGGWEARDVNGGRRVWATGASRRVTVGLAFQEIARKRRIRAAEIADKRKALGLEAVPPYAVEVTRSITLVLNPDGIGTRYLAEEADANPAEYLTFDLHSGDVRTVPEETAVLSTMQVGLLHHRCSHNPDYATWLESEPMALVYAREALTHCWPCTAAAD